jgi:ABC-type molybdenum transport system ATPase subunit/photorepair protein PhrA
VWEGEAWTVKTTAGIDFLFAQAYSTTPGANGLNYIGLSNDTLTETTASTALSSEIVANGLARTQGTYAHTAGTATGTVAYTFTATGGQSVRKAALFDALEAGTMNHALALPEGQRVLVATDMLAVTFTITLT